MSANISWPEPSYNFFYPMVQWLHFIAITGNKTKIDNMKNYLCKAHHFQEWIEKFKETELIESLKAGPSVLQIEMFLNNFSTEQTTTEWIKTKYIRQTRKRPSAAYEVNDLLLIPLRKKRVRFAASSTNTTDIEAGSTAVVALVPTNTTDITTGSTAVVALVPTNTTDITTGSTAVVALVPTNTTNITTGSTAVVVAETAVPVKRVLSIQTRNSSKGMNVLIVYMCVAAITCFKYCLLIHSWFNKCSIAGYLCILS